MGFNVTSASDFMYEISAGLKPGFSCVNKFGENPNSAIGTIDDLWDNGGTYTWATTADITTVSQDVDQVAMRGATIEVQGLDTNFDLVVQNVTLDATDTTTAVTLSTALKRVFRKKVLADVVSTSDIRSHNVGDTITYSNIQAGNNQTLMALYTIPNGKTAYLTCYYATVTPSTVLDPKSTEFRLWTADRASSYEFQVKHQVGLPTAGNPFQYCFSPYFKVEQKTDIKLTALCDSKAGHVHGGFDLILVDN